MLISCIHALNPLCEKETRFYPVRWIPLFSLRGFSSDGAVLTGICYFAVMQSVAQFYFLAHSAISLIGAVLLLAIYHNIRRRFRTQIADEGSHSRVDRGLLYLSFALFTWVVAGISDYAHSISDTAWVVSPMVLNNLFSVFNNVFFLIALYYFDNAPAFIYRNRRNNWLLLSLILIVAAFSLILSDTTLSLLEMQIRIHTLPDFLFSLFLSIVLAYTLYKTFMVRGLRVVAGISILVMSGLLISQIPEFYDSSRTESAAYLLKLISKTSLIGLFLVLATSWVIELANTPKPAEIRLNFTDWSRIVLNIPSKSIVNVEIDFGAKTTQFKNLLKFSIRRKFGNGDEQFITVRHGGEIKSQAYVSRIPDNINEILRLEGDTKLDRKDLFTFLGEGKYRLRLLPDAIEIEENLLAEFLHHSENEHYESFVTSCNPLTKKDKG